MNKFKRKKIADHKTFWKPHLKRRGIDPKKFLTAKKSVKKITGLDFTDFYSKVASYIYREENFMEKEIYLRKRLLKVMKSEKAKQIVELGDDFYELSSGNRKNTRLVFKLVEKNGGRAILVTTDKLSDYGFFAVQDYDGDFSKFLWKLIEDFENKVAEDYLLVK